MASTASRLINLIMLLQREPNSPASRLAQSLDVSVRTIQRYIGMLEDMGVPVYAERGTHGGYSLVRGYRMPPLMLSAEEAVAVYLGTEMVERSWGRLFRPAAQSALSKIANVLPHDQLAEIDWAKESLLTRGMPRMNPSVDNDRLHDICNATRNRHEVDIIYRGRGEEFALKRRINPYALVYSWGQQYCVAYCQLRSAIRSFRVDRIEALEVLPQTFARPEGFNPDDFLTWEGNQQPPPTEVQLRFPPDYAAVAKDHPCCWDNMTEHTDGSVEVAFKAVDLATAASRVLGFLPGAQIIGPEPLISLIRHRAQTIADALASPATINNDKHNANARSHH
ncbi:YafY family protein [Gilvimarinus sp. SDUM040013]|uniref:YafY family protein n=1 Tax=Gilvimarinus gilvus TaxID=3058038 RepID=A0ABU4S166_9GAMM|nr:YafY family protein [Gilvimarinus sp. SDUM040013]MDO3384830.1 YafY family protein [Gilvimarinus sp. SDUM040013]MDX6850837.1 YafY family protein [Gilvimarinus sp. SDUM040013]